VMAPGLLTDLLAGRRARPHVVLDVETNAEIDKSISYLDLRATVRNEGLSPVESYVCGIVSHAPFTLGRKPGFSVSRFLNILPTTLPLPGFEPRLDLHSDHTPLAPFDERAHALVVRCVCGRCR
jgi:hypothetical protein